MRKISLRRNGRVISELDVYEFLVQGDKSRDVQLAAGDVIVFQPAGPDEFSAVLDENELPEFGLRRVELDGAGVLLSRARSGEICAIAATCNHFGGPLEQGDREGDTVVCPLHKSRFDLRSGEAIDGPAVFPQSRYETRVRDGRIEVKASKENVERKVT